MQQRGEITYNGHHLNEFVVQRTAAYIEQVDLHIPEVRTHECLNELMVSTLNLSACCRDAFLVQLTAIHQAGRFAYPQALLLLKFQSHRLALFGVYAHRSTQDSCERALTG